MKKLFRAIKSKLTTPRIIEAVRADSLTYLEPAALLDLFAAVKEYEKGWIKGILIEAGCAAGGSAIVLAKAKSKERTLNIYDVFGMIPPPSAKDDNDVHERYKVIRSGAAKGLGARKYYGYEDDLLATVTSNFEKHKLPLLKNHIHLIKGLFQDTLHVDQPVALAHIDGDWYESVTVCLQRIEPWLVAGGRFVIDDYAAWSGCRKAVDDFFLNKRDKYEFQKKSRLHIVRKG